MSSAAAVSRDPNASGQSVWLDCSPRRMLDSGELKSLIERDGISGVSLDVCILRRAIAEDTHYDGAIAMHAARRADAERVWLDLVIEDAQAAAELFRPIYDATEGRDGFVSVPLPPSLARDATAMAAEARMLWSCLNRPNVLVRIPATASGISAIRKLTEAGVNVHATLLFGRFRYAHVANAYLAGLKNRADRGLAIDRVASVASIHLSPIDDLMDAQFEAMAGVAGGRAIPLVGKVAIAEAKLTYARYRDLFHCEDGDSRLGELGELARLGGRPQRLMWSKLGPKRDLSYLGALIEPDTIAELSLEAIETRRKLGHANLRSPPTTIDAALTAAKLAACGSGSQDIEMLLETEAIQAYIESYQRSIALVESRLSGPGSNRFRSRFGFSGSPGQDAAYW